ncbi:oxidoreductase [Rhodopseudomonas sp. B29]|uniref:oxidoreductase n=1 Tax=Rhodopseudomonas sp. B29 TaxID=95607 RepID=UPI000349DB65|nr:oxidoreductase [Rhodopseudomonas sp. B29]
MQSLSDEQCRRAAAAQAEHRSERKAAAALGLPRSTFKLHLHRAAERGMLGFKPVLPGFAIKQIATNRNGDGGTKSEWIQQRKESGDKFEIPSGQILKGISAYVDDEGRWRSGWIKTRTDSAAPELIGALKAEFEAYRGRAHIVPAPRRTERDLLAVYPIADPHIGMLSWRPQTGADYDLKIASERMLDCASSIVAKADRAREATIINLGDWYHANDQRNVTPKSKHQLDVDGRWFKVQRAGVRVFRSIIDMALAKHERVEVVNIPGNHDPEAGAALALALSGFYERNRRVKITFPADLYYRRFGNTLFGAAHGDKLTPGRMAMAMAVDQREAWGATAYHWFLFGHIHKDKLDTIGDVRVEAFSTIADKDNHAAGGGWRSAQALQVITLHRRNGEDSRQRVNIPPPSMR